MLACSHVMELILHFGYANLCIEGTVVASKGACSHKPPRALHAGSTSILCHVMSCHVMAACFILQTLMLGES